ncbi:MAG: anaerobic ribonucleoside-triphosphate reductase [Candidatus Margulisiibacteriota bacterium]
MTQTDLDSFLGSHPEVLWAEDEDSFYFHHEHFDKPEEKTRVMKTALFNISAAQLEKILIGGRNVEHITRVTGYFSRVSGWNKGKRGELMDRQRVLVNG